MPSRKAASRLLDALDKVDQEGPDAALARQLAERERDGWTPPERPAPAPPAPAAVAAPAPAPARREPKPKPPPGATLSVTIPRELMLRARAAVRAGGHDSTLVGLVAEALEREIKRLEDARGEPFDVTGEVPALRPGARLR